MSWGIIVEWEVRGLVCCGWMQRTDEPTVDDPKEFESEADAEYFMDTLPDMDLWAGCMPYALPGGTK